MRGAEHINKKIDDLDERSDEVKEILGKPPIWMVRWGTTIVFAILIVIIFGSSIVRYDDIIIAQITITTKTPPAYIKANAKGKLTKLFIETNENVVNGQILAEIENTASFDDVFWLKKRLEEFSIKSINLDSLENLFPSNLKLGEIQQAYADFITIYQDYLLYDILLPNEKEIYITSQQIGQEQTSLATLIEQLDLVEEELKLSKLNYDRNKGLLERGVISKYQFEDISKKYLVDRQKHQGLLNSISNMKSSIISLKGNKTSALVTDKERKYINRLELNKSLGVLKNEISKWELTYILKSPMEGKLTMFDVRSKNENVNLGDIVFTVVPSKIGSLIGKVTVPVQNSGKIKLGQEVIIKLDNYPFQEWGSLMGEIIDISEVPKKGEALYMIYVSIDTLITSYNKNLEFKQEMQGKAEIITEELSVLDRIFYQLKENFSRS